jgi:hypothetical protein
MKIPLSQETLGRLGLGGPITVCEQHAFDWSASSISMEEKIPCDRIEFTIELDPHLLRCMVTDASYSKGQKAQDGPLFVKITGRRPDPRHVYNQMTGQFEAK